MSTEINKRKPSDRSSPPFWFSGCLALTFPQDKVVKKVTPPPLPQRYLHRPFPWNKPRVCGGESEWSSLFSNFDDASSCRKRVADSPTTDWRNDDCQLDLFWNASGVKGWDAPLPSCCVEVSGATSQASLSYLRQVRAREQSKEHMCRDHVSIIPQLRKVTETIHKNFDSLPAISFLPNKQVSPEDESTIALRMKKMCCQFSKCVPA